MEKTSLHEEILGRLLSFSGDKDDILIMSREHYRSLAFFFYRLLPL